MSRTCPIVFVACTIVLLDKTIIDRLVWNFLIDCSWGCRLSEIKSHGSPTPSLLGEETKAKKGPIPGLPSVPGTVRDESCVFRQLQYSVQGYFVFLLHWEKTSPGHSRMYPPIMNFENELGHGTANVYCISLNRNSNEVWLLESLAVVAYDQSVFAGRSF